MCETSRLLGYYIKDGTITITAGNNDFAAPTDFVDVLWVRHNALYLKRSTEQEWLAGKINWTNATAGTPTEYSVSGTNIIVYPKPTADAVTAEATPDVRYIATPADYTGNGFTGLRAQDHFLPVYYGAALFLQLHNDVPEMQARAANLFKLFYAGCEVARPYYDRQKAPPRKTP